MASALHFRILLEQLSALPEEKRRQVRVSRAAVTAFLELIRKSKKTPAANPPGADLPQTEASRQPTYLSGTKKPPIPAEKKNDARPNRSAGHGLTDLRDSVINCTKCSHLVASRTQVVFGVGNPQAELMFVGEAPGADEDARGEPFVGRAGQLLSKIIEAMAFSRDEVYIANVLKCRPDMPPGASGNRRPTPQEMATCLPYLQEQIRIIRPRVIVALGAVALEGLLGSGIAVSKMRGQWQQLSIPATEANDVSLSIPLMPTYHPAYLLRNQSIAEKRKVWEDMLLVLEKLGRPITDKQRGFFLKK